MAYFVLQSYLLEWRWKTPGMNRIHPQITNVVFVTLKTKGRGGGVKMTHLPVSPIQRELKSSKKLNAIFTFLFFKYFSYVINKDSITYATFKTV